MNRRNSLSALLALGVAPLAALAQPAAKAWRLGFLGAGSAAGWALRVDALRDGLRDLGYAEGKNIVIQYRWADGEYERLPELAAELARLGVDVIVTHTTPGALAAKRTTTTIPIVMATSGDALASGLVASLARPGGNVTGLTFFVPELGAKSIELLKEIAPRIRSVAVLSNSANQATGIALQAVDRTAKQLKLELRQFGIRSSDELEPKFVAMANAHVNSVWIQQDQLLVENAKRIAELAAKYRLPSAGFGGYADAGGLIDYGVNLASLFRRAAYFVDRILKGTPPAELPVEQPTNFELKINLKTAEAIGIKVPQSLLLRADQVIT